jgi:hypothetical protein
MGLGSEKRYLNTINENSERNDATSLDKKPVIDLVKQISLQRIEDNRKLEVKIPAELEKQGDSWFLQVNNWILHASSKFSQKKMRALGLGIMLALAKFPGAMSQTHMSDSSALDFSLRGSDNSTGITPASALDQTNRLHLPLLEFDPRKVTPELIEHLRKVGEPNPERLIRDVSQGRYDEETAQSMTEKTSNLQNQSLRLRRKMKAGRKTSQSAMETSSCQLERDESKRRESLEQSKKALVNEHETAYKSSQDVLSDKEQAKHEKQQVRGRKLLQYYDDSDDEDSDDYSLLTTMLTTITTLGLLVVLFQCCQRLANDDQNWQHHPWQQHPWQQHPWQQHPWQQHPWQQHPWHHHH